MEHGSLDCWEGSSEEIANPGFAFLPFPFPLSGALAGAEDSRDLTDGKASSLRGYPGPRMEAGESWKEAGLGLCSQDVVCQQFVDIRREVQAELARCPGLPH